MADSSWYDPSKDRDVIKDELNIKVNDTVDDNTLDNYGAQANRKIDNLLFSYQDVIPVAVTAITDDCQGAARMYICYRYKVKQREFDSAKEYRMEFDSMINTVIKRLEALRTTRTNTVLVTDDPRRKKLLIPSQKDIFVLDDY